MYILDIQIINISKLSFCLLHSTDKYFCKFIQLHLCSLHCINSFAADFLAPSAGKNIYVTEIKLQSLTFVNTAITVANGTEGVLSTLVANGTGTVSTTVAIGSERVKPYSLTHSQAE